MKVTQRKFKTDKARKQLEDCKKEREVVDSK